MMKHIEVAAGVLWKRTEREILYLATQRGYGAYKGMWEFPGGKLEPGETPKAALMRELKEELNIQVCLDEFITTVEEDYPEFHITMHCYLCHIIAGQLTLLEHNSAKWITQKELHLLQWLPADIQVVKQIQNLNLS